MPGPTTKDQSQVGALPPHSAANPLRVWICHDERAGHISQLKGLIGALSRETFIEQHWFNAKALSFKLPSLINPSRQENSPDIVVAAGHGTHRSLLLSARAHHAQSYVLMKPSLPLRLFDGVICPKHDGLSATDRVFTTQGPITKVTISPIKRETCSRSKHLMIIGGPSKHFTWDTESLIQQVKKICISRPEIQWQLSDSPRTPKDFIDRLNAQNIANIECHHYQTESFGKLESALLNSAFTWVTPDSMSMIYESLTAGSPTALFSLPAQKKAASKRICRHITEILSKGMVTGFESWQANATHAFYPATPKILDEATRAAQWLLKRYVQLRTD